MCVCVCAIITSSGGKEQQSTSVPSALTVAASFLHLFGTLYYIILYIFGIIGSIGRVGIIGSIGSIGSIKQSKWIAQLHLDGSALHPLSRPHLPTKKHLLTNTINCARVLAFGHFIHFLRLVKLGQGGVLWKRTLQKKLIKTVYTD